MKSAEQTPAKLDYNAWVKQFIRESRDGGYKPRLLLSLSCVPPYWSGDSSSGGRGKEKCFVRHPKSMEWRTLFPIFQLNLWWFEVREKMPQYQFFMWASLFGKMDIDDKKINGLNTKLKECRNLYYTYIGRPVFISWLGRRVFFMLRWRDSTTWV